MKFNSATLALLAASLVYAAPTRPEQKASASGTSSAPQPTSGSQEPGSGDDNSTTNGSDATATATGGSKRGIPFNNGALVHLFPAPEVDWDYNWSSSPSGGNINGKEFVPMLFSAADTGSWQANAEAGIKGGAKHLLAFNEPDQPTSNGGSDMDAATAASLYKAHMNPFKGKAALGAPAISAGGWSWLESFAQACNGGCDIDFVPLHFYASTGQSAAEQATSFKGYMQETIPKVRSLFKNPNMPIWVTEFAALPASSPINEQLATEYMNDVLPWLDSNKDIVRYSYFYADALASGSTLGQAGKRYIQKGKTNGVETSPSGSSPATPSSTGTSSGGKKHGGDKGHKKGSPAGSTSSSQ